MKRFLGIAVVFVVVAAGVGAYLWKQKASAGKTAGTTKTGSAGASTRTAPPLKVSAVVLRPVSFAETVTSTGTLRAEEGVELQAEVNGKVVQINFTEGSRVKKGDLLVKLNDSDLLAMMARATNRLALARSRESRITRLFEQGIGNQDDRDSAINELNVQTAEVALIRAQIEKTEIRAPFDGVVGLRFVSEGAFVNANARIATLQGIDNLKVDFSVPERFAGRVEPGMKLSFTVAGGGERYHGDVVATDPRIDTGTRTLLVRAMCPNPGGRLRPGAFANVEVTLSNVEGALLVPSMAVVPGVSDRNVFVVVDGKAVRRPVETGTRTETSIHVLSGLRAGDVVITSGLQQMRAGLAVEPVFPKENESGSRLPGGTPPKGTNAALGVVEHDAQSGQAPAHTAPKLTN